MGEQNLGPHLTGEIVKTTRARIRHQETQVSAQRRVPYRENPAILSVVGWFPPGLAIWFALFNCGHARPGRYRLPICCWNPWRHRERVRYLPRRGVSLSACIRTAWASHRKIMSAGNNSDPKSHWTRNVGRSKVVKHLLPKGWGTGAGRSLASRRYDCLN